MKLSLVVAQGVHEGKVIPVSVAQFVIGRDPGCQLRPSSPAVSKRHCALAVKAGKVFVQDFGSTNGTFVNADRVSGEHEVHDGDKISVGPLEFILKVEATVAGGKAAAKPAAPTPVDVPTPPPEGKIDAVPAAADNGVDAEKMAALLLATDDGPEGPLTPSSIPDGTTVFEMPAVAGQDPAQAGAKPAEKVPLPSTSTAADAILRKYMRRPRT